MVNDENQNDIGAAGAGDGAENTMIEDAIENLLACIQLSEDFINAALSTGVTQRSEILSNLLIDCHQRMGDIELFREDNDGAIESYKKAVGLCEKYINGNERMMASTLFTIGCCYQ